MPPDRLAQEVEAVLHRRDPGLLVGEFETPLLQELFHERLDFLLQQEPRRACDDESSGPGEFHPPGPRGTGRGTLAPSGSYDPVAGRIPLCHKTNRLGSRRATRPSQWAALMT